MARVNLNILGRPYPFDVSDEEADRLLNAAKLFEKYIRDVQGAGRGMSVERIAVMAGLTIAFDAVAGQALPIPEDPEVTSRIGSLRDLCEKVLEN